MKQIGTMPGGSLIVELTPSDIEKLNAILDATTKAYKGTLSLFQTMPPMFPHAAGHSPLFNANPAILSDEQLLERIRLRKIFLLDDPRALAEVAKREETSKKAQES